MTRDVQRSRVYAWEGRVTKGAHYAATMKTLEEVEAFLRPIWLAERGRYGKAKRPAPRLRDGRRARAASCAIGGGALTLPRWSRNPWVIVHEMTHALVDGNEPGGFHGPRFVGALIGSACRHLGYVAGELMALADEMGVKYHVRSIGSVPVRGAAWHVERAAREAGPMTEIELAVWCDLSYLQVRGAALSLIRAGRARWLRRKLVLIGDAAPAPAKAPHPRAGQRPRTAEVQLRELEDLHGISVDDMGRGASKLVYPPADLFEQEEDDPHAGDHVCGDWREALEMAREYVALIEAKAKG